MNISKEVGCTYYPGFLVGVEFEIESVKEIHPDFCDVPYILHEENSLRNNGHEVVSKYPGPIESALRLHQCVFGGDFISFFDPNEVCSERGSIHVHVNFSDRTFEDVVKFITYYYLLEPFFFAYVNESRQNNIFTVPLSSTHMLQHTLETSSLLYLMEKWHKYTALNAKSLQERGTIEFRHLQITNNRITFYGWLLKIKKLYDLVFSDRFISVPPLSSLYRLVGEFNNQVLPVSVVEGIERNYSDYLLYTINPTKALITSRIKESKKDSQECVELPE